MEAAEARVAEAERQAQKQQDARHAVDQEMAEMKQQVEVQLQEAMEASRAELVAAAEEAAEARLMQAANKALGPVHWCTLYDEGYEDGYRSGWYHALAQRALDSGSTIPLSLYKLCITRPPNPLDPYPADPYEQGVHDRWPIGYSHGCRHVALHWCVALHCCVDELC